MGRFERVVSVGCSRIRTGMTLVFLCTYVTPMVIGVTQNRHVWCVSNPGWWVDGQRLPAMFSVAEAILTHQLVNHFQLEQPKISSLSVHPKLLDDECIEHRPCNTLLVDLNVPLVCVATLINAAHLVVEVNSSHVLVVLPYSGMWMASPFLLWRLTDRLSYSGTWKFYKKYIAFLSCHFVAKMPVR